jgi:hypothetical protein
VPYPTEDPIKEPEDASILGEVLILIGTESARRESIQDYVTARTLASSCGDLPDIPVVCRCVDVILREHPDGTIGGKYYRAFLQK